MGTNYSTPSRCSAPCQHCTDEGLHIGKRSAGWAFGFEAHPALGLTSWKAWQEHLKGLTHVVDEYGRQIAIDEFIALVEKTREPWGPSRSEPRTRGHLFAGDDRHTTDPQGWDFFEGDFS